MHLSRWRDALHFLCFFRLILSRFFFFPFICAKFALNFSNMAAQQNDLLQGLSAEIDRLKSLYEEVKRQNSDLSNQLDAKNIEIADATLRIKELERKNQTIKAVKLNSFSLDDAICSRAELLGLVREIDKCIALLNK